MAKFFPEFDKIPTLTQKPTDGELHALKVLSDLSDDYEVYFQPFINGHNPDIIVMRKNYGVLIIEVKDWKLNNYRIDKNDKNDNWILRKENIPIKSPIEQVKSYKDDLYDLSIPSLLELNIRNRGHYGIVGISVYFHYETSKSIKDNGVRTNKHCPIYGRNNFTVKKLEQYSLRKYTNRLFTYEIYKEFQRFLKPSFHTLEQAQPVNLSPKQKDLAISENRQQKIIGVAGSGKTLVLVQRAVNSHIRHGEEVLILTFNITLINYIRDNLNRYIHDNLNRVRQEFGWNNFHIIHYHAFIQAEINNHNIYTENTNEDGVNQHDENLFERVKDRITKYSAIFIDEIQDYKEEWVRIIRKYFLKDGGEFVVFGDEKQNIYDHQLDKEKKPNTTIPGKWNKLNESFRLGDKILQLAERFQNEFFKEKYELDKAIARQQEMGFNEENIEHYKFDDNNNDIVIDLTNFISEKLKEYQIQPQDACILAHKNEFLRELDFQIKHITKQKTHTTLEDKEMYEYLLRKLDSKIRSIKKQNLGTEKIKRLISKARYEFKITIRKIKIKKRFNFWMNSGGIKLSTVHSFKGWEIDTLFLIIDGRSDYETVELIYTALTRCRNKLFIININDDIYDEFFKNNT